jgi:hypothetical protein
MVILGNKAERAQELLIEKIAFGREKPKRLEDINIEQKNGLNPWKKFILANPEANKMIEEIRLQTGYTLQEYEKSWAVKTAYTTTIQEYNKQHRTNLRPRP